MCWLDTECDDLPSHGHLCRRPQHTLELSCVADEMVGGEAGHYHIAPRQTASIQRTQPDHRRSASALRLNHKVSPGQNGRLCRQHLCQISRGDDDDSLRRHDRQQPIHRQLKHSELANQFERLLGPGLARKRPQPRAGPTGHDQRVKRQLHQIW